MNFPALYHVISTQDPLEDAEDYARNEALFLAAC
jgi:hypothetical protein